MWIQSRRTKPRRGPLRDVGYREYLHDKPCAVCGREGCDAAHTVNGGLSMKGPDSSCAPLCREHHREYDGGRVRFESKYRLDMKRVAAAWWVLYQIRSNANSN